MGQGSGLRIKGSGVRGQGSGLREFILIVILNLFQDLLEGKSIGRIPSLIKVHIP
jgi:K+-transporting ATPase A subunit